MTTSENQRKIYTASFYTTFSLPNIEAHLYNPPADSIKMEYRYERPTEIRELKPSLELAGHGFPNGEASLVYRIEGSDGVIFTGAVSTDIEDGHFEKQIELEEKVLKVEGVSWEFIIADNPSIEGWASLTWSRFHGRVEYMDGVMRSTYIELIPVDFNAPGRITVPVAEDGSFDAEVPARIYAVINVNGAGYLYEAMERWGWDYNLLNDREDTFTIGRMELYGMHAFDVKSPSPTVFVTFRPTALSRVLQFDADGDGRLQGEERTKMEEAMRDSPTVIGPELEAEDVRVWLNGSEQKIVQFDKIPECNGSTWQVQYLFQIYPNPRPNRGVWHEVKIEVESKEMLHGEEVVDFGQGSVGFYRS